ncbi:MAG: hypothetical protein QOD94_257 [Alphaproteobacteria bacterium]|jgi:hypothetical protein|nr:hypothetical protein [Alphaproteobacteria bacterium]
MQTARRVLVILIALAAAGIVATMTVVVASTFAHPIIIGYRQVPGSDIYLTLQEWIYLARLLFPATSVVTAIPMMLVIVISEVWQLRSFWFYVLWSATLGAVWQVVLLLLLTLFWPGLADIPSGLKFLGWVEALAIATMASGAAGIAYWMIAGRNAGFWPPIPVVSRSAESR